MYAAETLGTTDKNGSRLKIKKIENKTHILKLIFLFVLLKNNFIVSWIMVLTGSFIIVFKKLNAVTSTVINPKYIKIGLPGNLFSANEDKKISLG